MTKYLYITLIVSASLACGAMPGKVARDPAQVVADTTVTVEMVVSGEWNIRVEPGETYPLVDSRSVLRDGDLVNCTEVKTVGDGLWCKHERGWSNMRGMTAKGKQ